eukprot:c16443_g1_i2.p1 GENE.c16443_g1_i2~~c16443_g1_i2.p1  ORF type:complete len:587 (+),score=244.62 c16443_g1_i2:32-1762(+)
MIKLILLILCITNLVTARTVERPQTNSISSCGKDYDGKQMAVILTNSQYQIVERQNPNSPIQPNEIAIGTYTDTIMTTGWSTLSIETNPNFGDEVQVQAAGFLEGFLTSTRIYQHATNTGNANPTIDPKLQAFLDSNMDWMLRHINSSSSTNEQIWWQVHLVLTQLHSLYDGYKLGSCNSQEGALSFESLLMINLDGDIEDLGAVLSGDRKLMADPFARRTHCSAVVSLTDSNDDLLVSQTTWSSLESMTRIYKMYSFALHETNQSNSRIVSSSRSAFSSYPGSLYSGDDFYVLSSGLIVQETTIGNSNPDLYTEFVSPSTILEWIRNIVANRLARSAEDWGDIFSVYNSGTYNNQFMIVDFNLFVPKGPISPRTLIVCEQIPGIVKCQDLSDMLQNNRFFGSYNIPFDPFIRNISGVEQAVEQYGNWFDYYKHPRAQIFAREIPNVQNVSQLQRLMRYNNFQNDELSSQLESCQHVGVANCSPPYSAENTISCRSDLNPSDGVYAFSALGHRDHAATDAKITSFSMYDPIKLPSLAVSGPTAEQVPMFVYSQSDFSLSHVGLPDAWNFTWQRFEW